MFEKIIFVWYVVFFVFFTAISFKALLAVDYSKVFKKNSTWQIRFLIIVTSIIIGFLIANAFYEIIDKLSNAIFS